VFPYLAATTLEEMFAPVASELGESIGRPVRYRSTSTFEQFAHKLQMAEYEIAHVNPFDFVSIGSPAGYLPVAMLAEPLLAAVVVLDRSPIRAPADLKGRILGLPPERAAVSTLARLALHQHGLRPGRDLTVKHLSSHESCLQQLQIGNIDACASGPLVLRVFKKSTKVGLRTVLESPRIMQTLFVVHARVPARDRELIARTLLSTDLAGLAPRTRLLFGDPGAGKLFRPVDQSELDQVRRFLEQVARTP
jgi:phosphonate transport system substrate-binding protein